MNKLANNLDSRWINRCEKILSLIEKNGEDFPTEEQIDSLAKDARTAFKGSRRLLEHALEKVVDIHRKWVTQNQKRTKWQKRFDDLTLRVMTNGDDFPSQEEIDTLLEDVKAAFGNSPSAQYYMDKAFSIRRRWIKQNDKRVVQDKEEARDIMEEQLALQEDIAASIKDVITKIARENNITAAETVRIKMSADEGLVIFQKADLGE